MAAASEVLMEQIAGEFSEIALCAICTEVFIDPRLLSCGHTFCLRCLQRCTEGKRYGETVACPVCRRESVIPSGGIVNLEKNRDMERLVETSRRVESRLKEGLYHCDKHDGKPVMLYCKTCCCLVCSTCIVTSHIGHEYQDTDVAADDTVKQLETKLGCTITDCVRKLKDKAWQINRANRSCQKAAVESRAKVSDHYKELETVIAEDRDSVLSELRLAAKDVQELRDQTNSIISKLQSFSSLREGKTQSLDIISQGRELLQLPVKDILSKDLDETGLGFEPNFKLLKLQSKAVNLVGTVSNTAAKKPGQNVKGTTAHCASLCGDRSSCYSENVPKSIYGASAVTDSEFEAGKVQPVCPDWCSCDFCEPMTDADERRCCASIHQVLRVCESAGVACVTQLPAFHVNCLNLSVIQLAFYEHHQRQQLSKPIHEIYRELSYVRFRRWIYRVPRGHVTNGVPACALDCIRRTFPEESSCNFVYPR